MTSLASLNWRVLTGVAPSANWGKGDDNVGIFLVVFV